MRVVLNLIWLVFGGLLLAFAYAVAALVMFVLLVTIPFLAGWWLALGHLITGVLMCLTVIGVPLGLANFKLIPVSLTPFGHDIVDMNQARRLGLPSAVAMPSEPRR